MKKEIEAKAWITSEAQKQEIQQFFETNGNKIGECIKKDTFYSQNNDSKNMIRLREYDGVITLTQKERKISSEGVEINEEREIAIQRHEDAIQILGILGYTPWYTKVKHALSYNYNGMTCEICTIEAIGCFLEIEKISETEDNEPEIQKAIYQLFTQLGLCNQIETKPYGVLLGKWEYNSQ